jgi:hypothetical protein
MQQFMKTPGYKCAKNAHLKIQALYGHKILLSASEVFISPSNMNAFIMAGTFLVPLPSDAIEQNKYGQLVSEIILKSTQADVIFVDDGRTTWIALFSLIKAEETEKRYLSRTYKRAKERFSKVEAQFFFQHQNEHLIPDMYDMIRTNDKSIKNEGIWILERVFQSELQDKFYEAIISFLKEGGLDTETKILVFQSFAYITNKQQMHLNLLFSYLRLVSENDEVKAAIVDILSSSLQEYFILSWSMWVLYCRHFHLLSLPLHQRLQITYRFMRCVRYLYMLTILYYNINFLKRVQILMK